MRLNIFQLKLLLEKINDIFPIYIILTGVHIGGYKTALRKRMNTNVTLRDNNESAPSTGILYMIVGGRNDNWLHKGKHAKRIANFGEGRVNCILIVKAFWVTTVAVNGNVFAKVC